MKRFIFLLCCPFLLCAEKPVTPQTIEKELTVAEKEYRQAKEMFNPWYTGPLITGGAGMMPPGMVNIAPYVFVNDSFRAYNNHGKSIDVPSVVNLNPQVGMLAGVTDWMDMGMLIQGNVNWKEDQQSGGYGDMSIAVGFPILRETPYVPAIKFIFTELFPTGRYQHLNPKRLGLSSTGGGAFVTTLGLNMSKLILWSSAHPMKLRTQFAYNMADTSVDVRGMNTYGGGTGTHGKIRPGNLFTAGAGIEVSFTQKWVFATDLLYKTQGKSKFQGTTEAPVGSPYRSNQFSIAPAIEYNWSSHLGVIAGAWFSVFGKNSAQFASGVCSVTYTFPI